MPLWLMVMRTRDDDHKLDSDCMHTIYSLLGIHGKFIRGQGQKDVDKDTQYIVLKKMELEQQTCFGFVPEPMKLHQSHKKHVRDFLTHPFALGNLQSLQSELL